jgi:adenylate cyclase
MDPLQSVGYGTRETAWLRLGVAVNAGVAYGGNVGGAVADFTALGDTVNVAARMRERTAAAELLIARGVADEIVARAPRPTLLLKDTSSRWRPSSSPR